MSVITVLQQDNPILHKHCETIPLEQITSVALQKTVTDLIDTMRDSGLIAIAAPQIGVNLRLFLTEIRATKSRPNTQFDELRLYFNPEIIESSEEQVEIYEGCGSVQGSKKFAPVLRSKQIKVKAYDQTAKEFTLECDGLLARAIQHECDHLQGREFTALQIPGSKMITRETLQNQILNSAKHLEACTTTIKELKFSTSNAI